MADVEEIVYVVAHGTIVYTDDGNVFLAGEKITPENVGNLSAFRALVAAGKIVTSAGDDAPPEDDSKWNYTEIDDRLSATSPNPVENRALYKEFETMGKKIAALTEAMAEPITQEDLREMWTENNQEDLNDGEKIS